MNITDIKIRRTYQDNRLRALVSVTIDGELAVHDIKVIEGPERLFVAMPSRRDDSGTFRDIAHPITASARRQMEDAILEAYLDYLSRQKAEAEAAQCEAEAAQCEAEPAQREAEVARTEAEVAQTEGENVNHL